MCFSLVNSMCKNSYSQLLFGPLFLRKSEPSAFASMQRLYIFEAEWQIIVNSFRILPEFRSEFKSTRQHLWYTKIRVWLSKILIRSTHLADKTLYFFPKILKPKYKAKTSLRYTVIQLKDKIIRST